MNIQWCSLGFVGLIVFGQELSQAMLNSCYLRIILTPFQDKMIAAFRLCQGLKEIDLIWVILKESKS